MKKRILSLFLILLLCLAITGCGQVQNSEKYQVICTGFAQYDWVRNIVGQSQQVELTLLANNSADLHNYQATVADLAAISDCDLFIYIGGTSDQWVTDALKNPRNQHRQTLALVDFAQKDQDAHHNDHEHTAEEHVWLSLTYADRAVGHIALLLGELDPENAEVYEKNAREYRQKLQELDGQYRSCVEQATYKTLLFADRFPFHYLTADYGLQYYAPFDGCSTETEASFATVVQLAQTLDKEGLPVVMVIEGSDRVIANTVIQNTKDKNQSILELDSIQGASQSRITNGETYLGIMEKNLAVLQQALN
ncbi:MAG: zinc ABC transporter substrate-binding protein [Clostridia bacterium]|nr:zinc ABC transporter substrate-binding protein [Clostridia bacterium]